MASGIPIGALVRQISSGRLGQVLRPPRNRPRGHYAVRLDGDSDGWCYLHGADLRYIAKRYSAEAKASLAAFEAR